MICAVEMSASLAPGPIARRPRVQTRAAAGDHPGDATLPPRREVGTTHWLPATTLLAFPYGVRHHL